MTYEIRYRAGAMREILDMISGASTLIIYQEEINVTRRKRHA